MTQDNTIKWLIITGASLGVLIALYKTGKKVYNKITISDDMFKRSAAELGVDESFLRALAEKEGNGKGFYLTTGKPIVRMENHILDRYYNGIGKSFNAAAKYGPNRSGSGEYDRFSTALADNRSAAIYSTSFGPFQIMGFNAIPIGYKSLEEFFQKMSTNADDQFEAMIRFIKYKKLVPLIKARNYNAFAKIYNGSTAYAQGPNGLEALHAKWLKKLS